MFRRGLRTWTRSSNGEESGVDILLLKTPGKDSFFPTPLTFPLVLLGSQFGGNRRQRFHVSFPFFVSESLVPDFTGLEDFSSPPWSSESTEGTLSKGPPKGCGRQTPHTPLRKWVPGKITGRGLRGEGTKDNVSFRLDLRFQSDLTSILYSVDDVLRSVLTLSCSQYQNFLVRAHPL